MLATPNQPVSLSVLAADGSTGLFARAKVYSSAGALVSTVNLAHVAEGLYTASYTPSAEGMYNIVYQFFTDSARTIPAGYDKGSDLLDVSSERTNITRILGLMNENSVFDNQVYNSSGAMTSGRIRAYDSAINAALAGSTGLLFSWTVLASYNGSNQLIGFNIRRDQ